jgi:ABC-type transport system involved in cytochrome bd biosynthesis fused ATPase/permease subunit
VRKSQIILMVSVLLVLLFSILVMVAAAGNSVNVVRLAAEFDNHCCR